MGSEVQTNNANVDILLSQLICTPSPAVHLLNAQFTLDILSINTSSCHDLIDAVTTFHSPLKTFKRQQSKRVLS